MACLMHLNNIIQSHNRSSRRVVLAVNMLIVISPLLVLHTRDMFLLPPTSKHHHKLSNNLIYLFQHLLLTFPREVLPHHLFLLSLL
nr:hypothetical protein Iba_chr04bCG12310 [Ipomoea batatas]GMC86420.1 hypothetical protein Iba_chr04dCG10790 [Ipomoea batatas]GMC89144.1 hypothetical protein Iba_chr04eCG16720 [Ipomoea batatas]GMC90591.1 hypothetical protein Iba_chr04fCG9580 [Ipomoea batatas]